MSNDPTPASFTPQHREVLRLANILYFRSGAFEHTHWMGHKAAKCPMDMWAYAELMHALQTDLVIETGTWHGGSALFFAHMLDIMGRGKVVSVDIALPDTLPRHDRIEYIKGSSTSEAVLETIGERAAQARSVLVILDSDHHADYKLKELDAYAGFVTPGSYMIAEDSCFDYYPAWQEFGPGPATAVRNFLSGRSDFVVDRTPERHLLSFAPEGFLKRVS